MRPFFAVCLHAADHGRLGLGNGLRDGGGAHVASWLRGNEVTPSSRGRSVLVGGSEEPIEAPVIAARSCRWAVAIAPLDLYAWLWTPSPFSRWARMWTRASQTLAVAPARSRTMRRPDKRPTQARDEGLSPPAPTPHGILVDRAADAHPTARAQRRGETRVSTGRLTIVRERDAWNKALASTEPCSVVAHFDYLQAGAQLEDHGRAELAIWQSGERRLLHPYVRRRIQGYDGLDDITSVFEFGGLWSVPTSHLAAEAAADFGSLFAAYCATENIVSEFTRVHPFADAALLAAAGYRVETASGHTVVPLRSSYAQIQAGYRHSLRKAIAKGERSGVRVEQSCDYAPFLEIYHRNLERLGAKKYYFFPRDFFERAKRYFDLYYAFDLSGSICAGHVYLRDGETIFAFLCHGVPESLGLRPNDCIYDYVIRREAQGRARRLHLGGGHPSLVRYKRRFSPNQVAFAVAKRVYDHGKYAQLAREREQRLGASLEASSYFPRYRASVPRPCEQPTLARSNLPTPEETRDD
ncbi:MAG: GNAT family N-acetyltransferase [Myxococcales bacterium FL481]|nr:MAG: GNAT family N-acetyltransferase [Myxococcales bacterium FL481]